MSTRFAEEFGAFEAFAENRDSFLEVLHRHRDAIGDLAGPWADAARVAHAAHRQFQRGSGSGVDSLRGGRGMANQRILIVEDSPTMRQLLVFALKRMKGVDIVEAQDGMDGLRKVTSDHFDLAFVDINMPVMDGLKLISL